MLNAIANLLSLRLPRVYIRKLTFITVVAIVPAAPIMMTIAGVVEARVLAHKKNLKLILLMTIALVAETPAPALIVATAVLVVIPALVIALIAVPAALVAAIPVLVIAAAILVEAVAVAEERVIAGRCP